jgi:hypothetical protein
VVPPTHANIVSCRWIYKIKRKADGTIERYKAYLVAKGFHQQEGIDFSETFSPIIKHATIRLVISLAVTYKWPIKQLDVQNAFLHGDLDETVFMLQPQGYIHPQYPHHVCKLHKSLYGLRQAPRSWFSKLSTKLQALGFRESKADTSLFVLQEVNYVPYMLIYVDDILITGSNTSIICNIISALQASFAVKDLDSRTIFWASKHFGAQMGFIQLSVNTLLTYFRKQKWNTPSLAQVQWHPHADSILSQCCRKLAILSFYKT